MRREYPARARLASAPVFPIPESETKRSIIRSVGVRRGMGIAPLWVSMYHGSFELSIIIISVSHISPRFKRIPDLSGEARLQESGSHSGGLRADAAIAATSIVPASLVVLGPEALASIGFSQLYIPAGFFEPFIKFLPVASGEATL